VKDLQLARKLFMKEHKTVFRVLALDAERLLPVRRAARAVRVAVP
jgi:hypothetical protein